MLLLQEKKENEVKEEIEKDNISKLLDNNVPEKKEEKALVEEIKVVNEIKENSNNYYINENQNNENNDGLNTDRTDNSKNEQDNTVSKPRKEKLTMKIKPKAKKSVKDENNN